MVKKDVLNRLLTHSINVQTGLHKIFAKPANHERRTYWFAWFIIFWGTKMHLAVKVDDTWLNHKAEHAEGVANGGTLAIPTHVTGTDIFKGDSLIIDTPDQIPQI